MKRTYSFGPYELDAELRCDGAVVHLEPKQLEVLRCICEHSGRRLDSTELRRLAWSGTKVSTGAVHGAISSIRKALVGITVSKKNGLGYQISADVEAHGPVGTADRWSYFVAHTPGTPDERAADADRLCKLEHDRYGA